MKIQYLFIAFLVLSFASKYVRWWVVERSLEDEGRQFIKNIDRSVLDRRVEVPILIVTFFLIVRLIRSALSGDVSVIPWLVGLIACFSWYHGLRQGAAFERLRANTSVIPSRVAGQRIFFEAIEYLLLILVTCIAISFVKE